MDSFPISDWYNNLTGPSGSVIASYGLNFREMPDQGIKFLFSLHPVSLIMNWVNVNGWIKWPIIGVLALCLTYFTSTAQFRNAMKSNTSGTLREAPVVPYWVPGVFHASAFLDPARFLLKLQDTFDSDTPLQLRAGPFRFFFYRNTEHIKAAFRASKRTTNKSTTLFALRNLFDLPKSTVQFFLDDDSGMGLKPRKESKTTPENRINYLITHNLKKFLSSDYLEDLDQRYMSILLNHLDTFEVKNEWVEFSDLHAFIQQAAIRPSVEALVGSEFFKLNPDFIEDLLVFQQYIPDFLHLLPRWLIPTAYRVRKRLLQSVKRWHKHAHEHYDCSRLEPEDPDWEPYFGSKLMRAREHYSLNTPQMTPDARATEDLGLIFVATTNIVTSIFWFVFEALKDSDLLARLDKEIVECSTNGRTKPEIKKLTFQPLLQSTYAEVLRLYIAVIASRVAEYGDIQVANYSIPKDSYLIMYSRSSALDHQAWERAGRTLKKPLEEFDAERFLVDPDWVRPSLTGVYKKKTLIKDSNTTLPKKRFTVEGLLGLWYPYGGGDRICPGRHYAKHQMMLTFAMLLAKFDFELTGTDASKALPNMRYAPFGALPPVGQIPFRMRRKSSI